MPKPYTPNDKWSQRAQAEGYRARSVYKLIELDERFKLLKTGMTILDLGAAPGSWSQYASKKVGPKGKIIALDLTEIEPIAENVESSVQDITDLEGVESILTEPVDVILSDLAPSTSGIKDVDQWQSIELSQSAVGIAERFLKKGGTCVLKIFRGADFDDFLRDLKKRFIVKTAQVKASRDRSREIYLILTTKS